ncbi:MAG: replicative DNA helicase [Clostridia bacterium]|nr:replicative DNA helicase [Clostridia bacterium]MBQ4644470.1 replicative DNA helicase [Clostridia bacterium]
MESNYSSFDNMNLPHSIDAEQAVLGALLKDPSCLPLVSDMLRIEHLYLPQHKSIYTAILNIDTIGGRIDPLVVLEELKKEGVYDDIGGKTYLMKIADAVPSTKNVESYIKIIIDKFYLRTLMETARDILEATNNESDSPDDILNLAEQKIYNIRSGRAITGPARVSDIVMSDVFERLKKLGSDDIKVKEQYMGIPTGFSYLDKILGGGFHRSDFIVVGARPAMGKTSFALNVARNIARNKKVLFFSLEMSKEQLAQRVISTEARIISEKLRTGEITDADWEKLGLALQNLVGCELYFDDTANINVNEMKARALRMKDVDCIVIDYLQLMSGTKRTENRVAEVSEITRSLKMMAKDLNIPVITCSQLSRGVAKNANGDHRPQMTDLRESGTIEQDADIVLMLHREDYYNNNPDEEKDPNSVNIAEIIVGKNRHGSTTTVKVAWNPEFTMFSTLERIKDDQ